MTVRDGLAPTTAGYCQIGAAGGPTVTNGFFRSSSIQCRLTRDVAKCGLDNCGDLVLWGEGEARQFSYVVIEGPLPQFTDGTCPRSPGSGFRQVTPLLAVDNTTQQLLDAAKQAGREAEARGEPVVNIGQFAYFYSGPITVQSRKSTSKWQHGWFTYAAIVSSITTNEQGLAKLEAENGPLPRVTAQDFNTFRFELYRDQEGF
jgi:hypothetical protein